MLSKTQLNCSWGFFPAPVCPPSSGRAVVRAARRPRVALTSLLTSDRLTRVQDNVTFEKTFVLDETLLCEALNEDLSVDSGNH